MQDQAEPRVTAATHKWLGRHMKGRLKCWPSKRGNLTSWDYGAWSQARESICSDAPATMLELRTPILRHLTAFLDEENRENFAAFPKRVRLCVVAGVGHFEENGAETL